MKGIVVCVNYDDLLRITLPLNMRHLTECLVVSAPGDKRTASIVAATPSANLYVTDAFYRKGAKFNKGAALEEGFDALGRDGWILVWDADTILPESVPMADTLDPLKLYGAKRRVLVDPKEYRPKLDLKTLPLSHEAGWPGYFQLFHASRLRTVRPWYATHSPHAAIGDAYFQNHWPLNEKTYLPIEVLHLGPRDTNWFGRVSPRLDGGEVQLSAEEMNRLFSEHRWQRRRSPLTWG